MKKEDIVYSLNVEDVQEVARREHDRELSDEELDSVALKLGDYIRWYEAVDMAIAQTLPRQDTPE